MSTFRSYPVQCACGHAFSTELAVAVNAVRMPRLRDAILEGRLHRATCPACARTFTVEKSFVYADLRRNLVVQVHPKTHAFRWRAASKALDDGLGELDTHGVLRPRVGRRIAFGIGELREKLVAQDADIDDRHVELAKVLAIHEHPVLLKRPRLRLYLEGVTNQELHFAAGYDHTDQAYRVAVPKFAFDRVVERARDWVASAHRTNLFRMPGDHWVSVQRWAPVNTALARLHNLAASRRAGQPVDLDAPEVQEMLKTLPRGSQLTASAKIDLRDLERYAWELGRPDLQDALFEVRFGVILDDEWDATRATRDIDTLWDLLKDLPDTNVEGNAHLHEIFLTPGDGGGLYRPTSHDVVVMSDAEDESFATTMRHEIGHAVQDKLDKDQKLLVTGFLAKQFGWRFFPPTTAGARAWGELMAAWTGLSPTEVSRICDTLVQSLGSGETWEPPQPMQPPADSPWWRDGFGPRLATQGSLAHWYASNGRWHRHGGYAFFLNYWYPQFMVVREDVLTFINDQMPWNYAAMSPGEFFAELYALFYNPDASARQIIPAEVAAWLTTNVGAPRVGAPAPPKS